MTDPANDLERRHRGLHVRVLAADEDGQRALARALRAARDGRVDRADAHRRSVAAIFLAVAGETVEQSTSTAPWRMPPAMPRSPSTISSRSGESETHVKTRSAAFAASAGALGADRAGRGERLLAGARAVVDVQLVAGGEQVPGHGRTHRSEADPGDSHGGNVERRPTLRLRSAA